MDGLRFGRLVVRELHSIDKNYNKRWVCLCDCGVLKNVLGDKLRNGKIKSCGCLQTEFRAALVRTANEERRLYTKKSYLAMMGRCYNPKYPSYIRYGAKGITVCDRWRLGENGKSGWLCFYADMGPKPTGYSIDRIGNDKGYYPENCRWATVQEQAANKTKKVVLHSAHLPLTRCL